MEHFRINCLSTTQLNFATAPVNVIVTRRAPGCGTVDGDILIDYSSIYVKLEGDQSLETHIETIYERREGYVAGSVE